eukprot:4571626-Pleurochrysis_carterae.AAC.6
MALACHQQLPKELVPVPKGKPASLRARDSCTSIAELALGSAPSQVGLKAEMLRLRSCESAQTMELSRGWAL